MMKTLFIASMLLTSMATVTHAASAPQKGNNFDKAVEHCGAFDTQVDMNVCSYKLLESYDKKLDTAYSKLIALVRSSPAVLKQVQAQEKSWVAYKRAYMEAAFPGKNKQLEYGTMYPLQRNLLEAGLVRDHLGDIQSLILAYTHR
jgi:uncharacterized protein YecT (DUF1311 family)